MQALLFRLHAAPETPADVMAAACGVDREDLRDMMAELRALDPRPGLRFGARVPEPAAPDVLATPDGAGGWRVTLNPETLPRLIVDRDYAARVGGRDARARLFLLECGQNASWLQRSLDQRARTIVTVAAEIVRAQSAFLTHGVGALRPMTLRQVAEAVSLHESTVSRVTANKVMATPRGLIALKAFFSVAVGAQAGGDAHSAEAVRARIRALVAAEPPAKPLSDEHLVAALQAEGMDVARRTVAKYRESLNIPSSVARRRRAKAAL
jgi:RNA polymerase sigma-54 factor